jgi:hypothetical protein
MDLDTAADELYGISPDEFVDRRTELVREARAAGDRSLATEIGQLRKPTRTAWLVNLLARSAPDRISELFDLGRQLQEAQRAQSAAELRRLSAHRRTIVDGLSREATELGRSAGYSPPEAAVQEVSQTLQAALGDPGVGELVRRGRLVQVATYGGFGPLPAATGPGRSSGTDEGTDLLAALTASVGRARGGGDDAETPKQARQQAKRDLDNARDSWEAASREADEAAAAADQASDRADDLAAEIESIRGRLRAAEAAERDARAEARAARKRALQLRQAVAAAEQRVNAARDALEALEA